MILPAPETCLAYASALEKPYRDYRGGVQKEPGEVARAAAAALRMVGPLRAQRDALALQVAILTNERDTAMAQRRDGL